MDRLSRQDPESLAPSEQGIWSPERRNRWRSPLPEEIIDGARTAQDRQKGLVNPEQGSSTLLCIHNETPIYYSLFSTTRGTKKHYTPRG